MATPLYPLSIRRGIAGPQPGGQPLPARRAQARRARRRAVNAVSLVARFGERHGDGTQTIKPLIGGQ
ncbi:MAG: hypothetical protein ACRDG4_13140 [Chloroflexota bacterium]